MPIALRVARDVLRAGPELHSVLMVAASGRNEVLGAHTTTNGPCSLLVKARGGGSPLGLDRAIRSRRVGDGDVVLLLSAGTGYTWAATVIRIGEFDMNVGDTFGPSSWVEITQERIDLFAEATGDHQWIHVDPERAKDGPFGTTIAHGYLTLSLIPMASAEVVPSARRMGINYGVNRVRFPAPVPVGSRVRIHFEVARLEQLEGARQVTMTARVEREGGEKPVCVAEVISRHYD